MRRIILCLLAVSLAVGCAPREEKSGKLQITATLFPQYDFCRQIAGERAEVTLLLPPGMESHNYEPSVSDILSITKSDLFVYTGPYMEAWAQTVIEGLDDSVRVVDVSQDIALCEHEDHEEHAHAHEEQEEMDPHIWTDPLRAVMMAENILTALCEEDPKNSGYYTGRAEAYIAQLHALDEEFSAVAAQLKSRVLCHGGRFSMTYFARRYDLTFIAAFDSCSSQAEPSAARVIEMIQQVREQKLPAVFYEELTQPRIAQVISEETGAILLLLHTCHNVSKKELEEGVTYLSLMQGNLENLKKYVRMQQNDC